MNTQAMSNAADAGTVTLGGELRVHRMGYGAMRLTGPGIWGEPQDREGALRLLRRAVELGVNFIDTADAYGPEVNELQIAQALHPYPAGLVIATKGGMLRPGPDQWERDCSPAHLRRACEASLKRLRLERIDLYQLHGIDPKVPLEDSLGALAKLQQQDKIRHVGVSNVSLAELERAAKVVKVVSVQNRYNADDRASEEIIDYCEQRQIAFIPWYPLAAGEHAGARDRAPPEIERLAGQQGLSLAQAALAQLLARSPVMLVIPGTSSIEHLEENVAAAGVRLGTL